MKHRYDFLFLFDCTDANPNGDPDAGNLPRIDTETGQGLVTDVCIKRKIRDYIDLTGKRAIYVRSRAVLNTQNNDAWEAVSPDTAKAKRNERPADEKVAKKLRDWMCEKYYDIRTFGAVMTNEINCGQVRGPVQISFARSIDPILSQEHSIAVCAARKEGKSIDSQIGLQGRKFTIPYGLYKVHGFVNPFLAKQTGFSEGTNCGDKKEDDRSDLELLFTALENAFQFDPSAARPAGSMAPRKLIIFKHPDELGNAPSHELLEGVCVVRENVDKVPRSFSDYKVTIKEDIRKLCSEKGIEIIENRIRA
jgi:CRISPR-associated protein Csd2